MTEIIYRKDRTLNLSHKISDLCSQILGKMKIKNLKKYCKLVGRIKKGHSYGTWSLLADSTPLRSLTGIAARDNTTIYYLMNEFFFEGIRIGLHSSSPTILKIFNKFPILCDIPKSALLRNIAKVEPVELKFKEMVTVQDKPAEYIFLVVSGRLLVIKNFFLKRKLLKIAQKLNISTIFKTD